MAKKKRTPFHIVHKYKMYEVPDSPKYGKYQGDIFWAKDGVDSVLYLNKLVSLRA